jgi:hypothetical protein
VSSAKSVRKWVSRIFLWWASRAFQEAREVRELLVFIMDHAPVYLDGLLRYQLSQPDVEQGTLNVRAIAGRLMGRRRPAF